MADPGGQEIFVIACMTQQKHACAGHQVRIGTNVEVEVAAHAAACIDRDGSGEALGWVPGVLQRFPGDFQELAVLRIHDGCFFWAETKEVRIELLKAFQRGCRRHVVAVAHALRTLACCKQLGLCQMPDRLNALAQVGPVGGGVGGTRQVRRHADDGNVIRGGGRRGHSNLSARGTRSCSCWVLHYRPTICYFT